MTAGRIIVIGGALVGAVWLMRKVLGRMDTIVAEERVTDRGRLRLLQRGSWNTETGAWEGPTTWALELQDDRNLLHVVAPMNEQRAREMFTTYGTTNATT